MGERPIIMPLRYEPEAAKVLGISQRALRSEREAGRIGLTAAPPDAAEPRVKP